MLFESAHKHQLHTLLGHLTARQSSKHRSSHWICYANKSINVLFATNTKERDREREMKRASWEMTLFSSIDVQPLDHFFFGAMFRISLLLLYCFNTKQHHKIASSSLMIINETCNWNNRKYGRTKLSEQCNNDQDDEPHEKLNELYTHTHTRTQTHNHTEVRNEIDCCLNYFKLMVDSHLLVHAACFIRSLFLSI